MVVKSLLYDCLFKTPILFRTPILFTRTSPLPHGATPALFCHVAVALVPSLAEDCYAQHTAVTPSCASFAS